MRNCVALIAAREMHNEQCLAKINIVLSLKCDKRVHFLQDYNSE